MTNDFDNLGTVLEGNSDPDEVIKVLIQVFKIGKRLNLSLIQACELYNKMIENGIEEDEQNLSNP